VIGRDAVRRSVEALFAHIATLEHAIHDSWESDAMLVYEAEVRYAFRSGKSLRVPYVNVLRLDGALVADYRIYLNPTELNAILAAGNA
jgi:ketosteroid isomerase-like protein